MARVENNPDSLPINIPSRHQRRSETGNNLTNVASSLTGALQSWTRNYSLTASTYTSNNFVVPVSFIGSNYEQAGTFGQIYYYRPGGLIQNPGPSSIQSYNTISPSPHSPPSNYGSITQDAQDVYDSKLISANTNQIGEDLFGISFTDNNTADDHKIRPTIISEHTPIVRKDLKGSYVLASSSTDKEIPERVETNFRQSIFNSCNNFIGANAFGEKSRIFISVLFCLELLTLAVALIILIGDSLYAIFPDVPLMLLKVIAWMIMTPLTLITIRHFSYLTLFGILSAICLVSFMIIDGFAKHERPGSLIDPMETDIFPFRWYNVPMSFGLIMAGFTGHVIFPNVYRDMQNPKQYPRVVNCTYVLTAALKFLIAVCGYLMFGNTVMQEVTQNLIATQGCNRKLEQFMIWLVVVYSISKYAFIMNPINLTFEIYYHSIPRLEGLCKSGRGRQVALRTFTRISLSAIVLLVALQILEFERVVGVLGSFFSLFMSVIFPCTVNLKLFGRRMSWKEKTLNICLLIVCSILSALGTIWSFLPTQQEQQDHQNRGF
ncbi:8592_t:CDS:2 [Funneliformis caledonium]|uniref:8592_t:CDS:1 n=1 Tax=Funneliformis caledonium TaxID=1117310 RepID=A0A9N8W7P9_9GLOM|nr:8592_t:CDS:2 [Funneliformis caledonium]